MSELTICNYCEVKRLKKEAKSTGLVVTKRAQNFGLGGHDYFVHPKHIKIDPKNSLHREKYFRLWAMETGKYCEC